MPRRAGRISGEWKGAETASSVALRTPRSLASAIARSTARRWPATTVWPGALRLATAQTSPGTAASASRATAATAAASSPRNAAIAPSPTGTASCISSPRRRTSRSAASKSSAPAATRAEYSPRLCPAIATAGGKGGHPAAAKPAGGSAAARARWMAVDTASSAGWVLAVRLSSSSGPSQQSRVSGQPRTASASASVARAAGEASAQALPIPTFCDPCPGKT